MFVNLSSPVRIGLLTKRARGASERYESNVSLNPLMFASPIGRRLSLDSKNTIEHLKDKVETVHVSSFTSLSCHIKV